MKLLTLHEAVDKARLLKYQQEAIDGLDDPEWDVSLEKITPKTLELLSKSNYRRGIKTNMSLVLSKEGCPNINIVLPKTDDGGSIIVAIRYYINAPYTAFYTASQSFEQQMKEINFMANVLSLKAALLHMFDKLTLTEKHELTTRDTVTFTCERHEEPAISIVMNSKSMDYAVTTVGESEHRFKAEAQAIAQVRKFMALNKSGD
jgi:hypothetical protein